LGENTSSTWGKSKSGSFYTPRKFFLPTVKRSKFNSNPNVDLFFPKPASHYFAPRSLITFAPKRLLKKERKKRNRGRE